MTHVLSIVDKGYTHEETITMDEVIHAVALWQCLQKGQDSIEAHFADYDTDNTDSLDASQVRHMLTDLNDGHLVSLGEVDWVIESADDGDGKLTRDEARSAIALWYMNVGLSDLTPNQGAKTLIPWIYAFVLGLMCCLLVAAVSVQFSEEKTMGWIECSVLGLFWKLFVMDPAKTLCCGTLLEPIFTVLFGDSASDAALNTVTDTVDGQLEEMADLADDIGGMMEGIEGAADATADATADGGDWGSGALGVNRAQMLANMAAFHNVGAYHGKIHHKLKRVRARRQSAEHHMLHKADSNAVMASPS